MVYRTWRLSVYRTWRRSVYRTWRRSVYRTWRRSVYRTWRRSVYRTWRRSVYRTWRHLVPGLRDYLLFRKETGRFGILDVSVFRWKAILVPPAHTSGPETDNNSVRPIAIGVYKSPKTRTEQVQAAETTCSISSTQPWIKSTSRTILLTIRLEVLIWYEGDGQCFRWDLNWRHPEWK